MPAKAQRAADCLRLEQLPNVGPAIATDLRLIGIVTPAALSKRDPYALYRKLCLATGQSHDPCIIDVFLSAVRFMQGETPRPWWHYTDERKRHLKS